MGKSNESLDLGAVLYEYLQTKPGSCLQRKGRPPKSERNACLFLAGPEKNIRRTVTLFCEALSMAVLTPLFYFSIEF